MDPVVAINTHLHAAVEALEAATGLADGAELDRTGIDGLTQLAAARVVLERALMHSEERYMYTKAGMRPGGTWDVGDEYDAVDTAWNVTVAVADERDPVLELDAADDIEANKRAATWAKLEMDLPEAIVIDTPRARLAGSGTCEVAPGRWQVHIEGW